jgi:4-amino-4-deoxy-L-arabinose transferase-like glycosyltransferase
MRNENVVQVGNLDYICEGNVGNGGMHMTNKAVYKESTRILIMILLAAAALRLAWVLYSPALPAQDFSDYQRLALSVVNGQGYSGTAGATAFRPPGYPLFLAALFWIFGQSLLVAKLANVALGVASVYLIYCLTRRIFTEQEGIIAAVLTACMPSLILYTSLLATENLATFLLLLGLYLFIAGTQVWKFWPFLLSGLAFGLAALTRPNFLLLPPLLGSILLFMRPHNLRQVIVNVFLLAMGMIIMITPWNIRNQIALGHFIPISTNGGFNLLISFHEDSTGDYLPAITERVFDAPFDWSAYRLVGLNWDEYAIDKAASAQALSYVSAHPERVLTLAPSKLFYLLRDDVSGVYENGLAVSRPFPIWLQQGIKICAQLYYMAVIALALGSVAFRKRLRNYRYHLILVTPLLFLLLMHTIFFGMDRFHLPFLPLAAAFSAFALVSLVQHLPASQTKRLQTLFTTNSIIQLDGD